MEGSGTLIACAGDYAHTRGREAIGLGRGAGAQIAHPADEVRVFLSGPGNGSGGSGTRSPPHSPAVSRVEVPVTHTYILA